MRRGRNVLFEDVTFAVHAGQRLGLVGANGSGKTSLFAAILGELDPDAVTVQLAPGARIAHVAQESPRGQRTALDFVMDGDTELRELQHAIAEADKRDQEPATHTVPHALFERLDAIGGYAADEPQRRTPAWDAQFRAAAAESYRQLQLMTGPKYGVYWIDSYNATDDPAPRPPGPDSDLVPEELRAGRDREVLGPGEHPFPTRDAVRASNLAIEPSIYMAALLDDFLLLGGRLVIRRFESPRELATLPEPVVVNCTGLGSFSLFDDKELVPIKGQLTFVVPQAEVNYRVSARLADGTNVGLNPRSDGIVVGNSQEPGVWSLDVNEEIRTGNMEAAMQFIARTRPPAGAARR